MREDQIKKDIEDCGISQWYGKKGLHSVYEEENGYAFFVSIGNRLSDGVILEEYHGITLQEIQALIA